MVQDPIANIHLLNPSDFPRLHKAAYYGNTECVEALIADGEAPNAKYGVGQHTPLHLAASNGHTKTVQVLIELCADVDVKDGYGYTPLQYADGNGHTETAQALRDATKGNLT